MLKQRLLGFFKDPVWSKVILFSTTLFLLQLADGVISYWAPNQIQASLKSPLIMGLIISTQSVVGLFADLVFPRMLKTARVRKLVFWAIMASAVTSLFLAGSAFKPFIGIFLVTMAFWGVYYELITFANHQFMGSVVPVDRRSGAWGIMGIFLNLAYFLGPLIAAFVFLRGTLITATVVLILLFAAFIVFTLTRKLHDAPTQIRLDEINPWGELKHWFTLSEHIWPAIVISVLLGFIDSTFWTTGAVWTQTLAQKNPFGALFLPMFLLPSIALGAVVAKWGIYKGKKILAEKFLIFASFFLLGLGVSDNVYWQILMVTLCGVALAVCYPLVQGVYSDIIARMGKSKKEMIGLTSSVVNIAYIVWPPVAGYVALKVGERLTFSVVGALTLTVSVILLFVTPKKLRLPQEEIKTWE